MKYEGCDLVQGGVFFIQIKIDLIISLTIPIHVITLFAFIGLYGFCIKFYLWFEIDINNLQ